MDRQKLIETLASQTTDAISLDDLLRFFYDHQVEYLEEKDDAELKRIAEDWGLSTDEVDV